MSALREATQLLNCFSAADGAHYARELGEYAVARGVDDPPTMFRNHRENTGLKLL